MTKLVLPIISQIIKTSKILYGDLSEINILPGVSVLKRTPFLDSSKANDLHIKDKAALLIPYSPNPKNGFDPKKMKKEIKGKTKK